MPGKPGTPVVRSHSITCHDSDANLRKLIHEHRHLCQLIFVSFSNQDVQKALASFGIQVCGLEKGVLYHSLLCLFTVTLNG